MSADDVDATSLVELLRTLVATMGALAQFSCVNVLLAAPALLPPLLARALDGLSAARHPPLQKAASSALRALTAALIDNESFANFLYGEVLPRALPLPSVTGDATWASAVADIFFMLTLAYSAHGEAPLRAVVDAASADAVVALVRAAAHATSNGAASSRAGGGSGIGGAAAGGAGGGGGGGGSSSTSTSASNVVGGSPQLPARDGQVVKQSKRQFVRWCGTQQQRRE